MICLSNATMRVIHAIGKTTRMLTHIARSAMWLKSIILYMTTHRSVIINSTAMLSIITSMRVQTRFNHVQLHVCNVINLRQWITRTARHVRLITAQ
jgi:hypothetical protein